MQKLLELVRITKEIKLKTTDLLMADDVNKSKEHTFYQKLLNNDFATDKEAATFLFQSDTSHSGYKNLKSSLKEKLVNMLFFRNPKKAESDFGKAILYSQLLH